jgi:hypothetical protein
MCSSTSWVQFPLDPSAGFLLSMGGALTSGPWIFHFFVMDIFFEIVVYISTSRGAYILLKYDGKLCHYFLHVPIHICISNGLLHKTSMFYVFQVFTNDTKSSNSFNWHIYRNNKLIRQTKYWEKQVRPVGLEILFPTLCSIKRNWGLGKLKQMDLTILSRFNEIWLVLAS